LSFIQHKMEITQKHGQVAILSIFRFGFWGSLWGLSQMAIMPRKLQKIKNLVFFKVLGTGGGTGYSAAPGFKKYALLTLWNSMEEAEEFYNNSQILTSYRKRKSEELSIFMRPLSARGEWSKKTPFLAHEVTKPDQPLAVITRASIKWRYIPTFWKKVRGVSMSQRSFDGQLYSQGIGELPWVEQATFTIWTSLQEMKSFAYGSNMAHMDAIKTTRKHHIFSEEMYARFQVIKMIGTMDGKSPMLKYTANQKPFIQITSSGNPGTASQIWPL
jgi:heme-degrading monooxygenase HmoA